MIFNNITGNIQFIWLFGAFRWVTLSHALCRPMEGRLDFGCCNKSASLLDPCLVCDSCCSLQGKSIFLVILLWNKMWLNNVVNQGRVANNKLGAWKLGIFQSWDVERFNWVGLTTYPFICILWAWEHLCSQRKIMGYCMTWLIGWSSCIHSTSSRSHYYLLFERSKQKILVNDFLEDMQWDLVHEGVVFAKVIHLQLIQSFKAMNNAKQ